RQLAAYVTVLPSSAKTINVNFMPPGLLEAMIPGLSPAAALEVLANRPVDGWTSRAEFLDNPVFFGLDADTSAQLDSLLDVQSRYFELYTRIRFGERERLQWALIARTGRRSHHVIAQERNPLCLPEFETEDADDNADEDLAE
ncbi:MAG: type II secretion system protein GspK, partial [Moraxellaceae bacterium]|nr:type II secretion system protein GspK [Moraxellaceae bacterium]